VKEGYERRKKGKKAMRNAMKATREIQEVVF
jgi:hypothetical protein